MKTSADSENFCLQWNDFVENVTSSVSESRTTVEFTDVTLACGDGQKIKGHKLILASGSLTFKDLLKQNPDPNVLIFMRGVTSSLLKLKLKTRSTSAAIKFVVCNNNFLGIWSNIQFCFPFGTFFSFVHFKEGQHLSAKFTIYNLHRTQTQVR